jgi:predicted esterase YcpF (UPF0227 family)
MIVYLHGFNSSPASGKARQLGEYMAGIGRQADYYCPALPTSPREAIAHVEAELARRHPESVTLIGSSLGGFYATHLAEKHGWKAVLVNPAVHAHQLMRAALGPQTNWHSGEKWELTEAHLTELAALDVSAISQPERYLLLAQTGDEVLDYRRAVERHAGAQQVVVQGGDHSLQSFPEHLPRLLAFAGH